MNSNSVDSCQSTLSYSFFGTGNPLYLAMTLIYNYTAYLGISKFVLFRCEIFPGPVLVGFWGFFFFCKWQKSNSWNRSQSSWTTAILFISRHFCAKQVSFARDMQGKSFFTKNTFKSLYSFTFIRNTSKRIQSQLKRQNAFIYKTLMQWNCLRRGLK